MLLPLPILALANQDDRAFMTKIYLDNHRLMYKKALSVLGDAQSAEDVVGDACIALIGKIPLIRQMDCYTLRAYIVSTVRNTAINLIARRSRQAGHAYLSDQAPELEDGNIQQPLDLMIRREDVEALKEAIRRLEPRDRQVLTMKYFDEMSDREIAGVLGIGADSVRSCLMRARRRVQDKLKERSNG